MVALHGDFEAMLEMLVSIAGARAETNTPNSANPSICFACIYMQAI